MFIPSIQLDILVARPRFDQTNHAASSVRSKHGSTLPALFGEVWSELLTRAGAGQSLTGPSNAIAHDLDPDGGTARRQRDRIEQF